METIIKHAKCGFGIAMAVLSTLIPFWSFAQVRIDWQQCYGNEGSSDYAVSIAPANDGFVVLGRIEKCHNPGLCHCDEGTDTTPWLIKIDSVGMMAWQQCWQPWDGTDEYDNTVMIRKAVSPEGMEEYYTTANSFGTYFVINKVDGDGEVLWRRFVGITGFWMCPTADGGVILGGTDGDGGGGKGIDTDDIIKLDCQGEKEWGLSLQLSENVIGLSVYQSNDEDFYALAHSSSGAHFYKISRDGQIEWRRNFGEGFYDRLYNIVELDDGFLLAGQSVSGMNGHHGGSDVWLVRTNKDGEVLWTYCYGGSSAEYSSDVFVNAKGGFTVFANTQSVDGDVQSNSQGETNVQKIWMFHINDMGALEWELSIGAIQHSVRCNDVIQTCDYRYVLAGWMWNEDTPSGDVNCSNSQLLPSSEYNYWVLQVTDTINSAGVSEPVLQNEMRVFPNPTNELFYIAGLEPVEVQVLDDLGQRLKTFHCTNEIHLGGLPRGLYFIKAIMEDGKVYLDKVVKE